MGAIAAVLLDPTEGPPRQQPLTLTAAKSMMGHSEPAAGNNLGYLSLTSALLCQSKVGCTALRGSACKPAEHLG